MLTKEQISEYLEFLEQHASELASNNPVKEEHLRSINLEINKLVERLEHSPASNEKLIRDVAALKVQFREDKPPRRRYWIYLACYGVLRFFPGALLVYFIDERSAKIRKERLREFVARAANLRKSVDDYGLPDEA